MLEVSSGVPPVSPKDGDEYKKVHLIVQAIDELGKDAKPEAVFGPEIVHERERLKNLLSNMILSDPAKYGSKCDEIIWHKVFYEPARAAKVALKNREVPDPARLLKCYRGHITSAIGFYQNLLIRLQHYFYSPDVWKSVWSSMGIHIIYRLENPKFDAAQSKAAEYLAYNILLYIGHLYRYQTDAGDFYSRALSYSYYKMASNVDPDDGNPHNQLGNLDVGRCFDLNAVFHCLRALVSPKPFEGAKANLFRFMMNNESAFKKMSEKSRKSISLTMTRRKLAIKLKHLQPFVVKYLFLIHRNTQSYLSPDADTSELWTDFDLMGKVLEDLDFILVSESKKYGAKCITAMLPKFNKKYYHVPDFCPNAEALQQLKPSSSVLLQPIILRMILTNILFIDLLRGNSGKSDEEVIEGIFDLSKELPLLALYSLDSLLIHSFRAIAQAVNIFKVTASKKLHLSRVKTSSSRVRRSTAPSDELSHEEDINDNPEPSEGDEECNRDAEEEPGELEEEEERGEEQKKEPKQSNDALDESGNTEDDDYYGSSRRCPRMRRLRRPCRMIDEDDFLSSSMSENEDDEEDEEDSEDSFDGYERRGWDFSDQESDKEQGSEATPQANELQSPKEDGPQGKDISPKSDVVEVTGFHSPDSPPTAPENPIRNVSSKAKSEGGSSNEGYKSVASEGESANAESEESSLEEDSDLDPNPTYIWLRLFVAAHFIDSFLAGIKLLTDWLTCSEDFLKKAASSHLVLMQEVASHLASLLNYFSPIVSTVEAELDTVEVEYPNCPGVRKSSDILPYVSSDCRKVLRDMLHPGNSDIKQRAMVEDWLLRGTPSLSPLHCKLDFDSKPLSDRIEQTIVRCVALTLFGHRLADRAEELGLRLVYRGNFRHFAAPLPSGEGSRMRFNHRNEGLSCRKFRARRNRSNRNRYRPTVHSSAKNKVVVDVPVSSEIEEDTTAMAVREDAMRNMARMRLMNEVSRLSEKVDTGVVISTPQKTVQVGAERKSSPSFFPYLLIDSYCLIGNTSFIKRMFESHEYVVIIPRKVIAHLDQMKKAIATARSATRVLEEHIGGLNSFVRIQSEDEVLQERIRVNFSTPSPSNGDAQQRNLDMSVAVRWASIIECAIYFAQKSKRISHFAGAEINVSGCEDLVNVFDYQASLSDQDEDDSDNGTGARKINILVGAKSAPKEDLMIPASLLEIAHESGIVFVPLHRFAQRWKLCKGKGL